MYHMKTKPKSEHPVPLGIVGREHDFRNALAPFVDNTKVILRYYPSGRDALRRATVEWNAVWIIDLTLDDMNAFDLFEMIRDRLQGATVCMVGRQYRAADEINTYRVGATIYTCRPLEINWLRECVERLLAGRKTRDTSYFAIDPLKINSIHSIRRKNDDSIPIGFCRGNGNG